MSRSLASLDPQFRPYAEYLVQVGRSVGRTTVTSTRRTWAEQAGLYEAYRAGRRPLPVAPPGRSRHVWGLAVDLVVGKYRAGGPPSPEMQALGEWWRKNGGVWGGKADPVHFSV